LAIFLADAAEGMAQLAGCGEDRARIRREAHALKSSAATLGFAELARLARELEPQAATLEPARLRQAVAALARCFAATRERLGAPP
jgi:HPt (histidine-containing phosphotransfer) domain-containing protein